MANRIMLNQTSYHGAGAIAEIVTEAKAHAFQKAFDPTPSPSPDPEKKTFKNIALVTFHTTNLCRGRHKLVYRRTKYEI